jgi:hypothetical protein
MAGKSGRPKLILSPEQKKELARLSHARGSPAREVQRAQILASSEKFVGEFGLRQFAK